MGCATDAWERGRKRMPWIEGRCLSANRGMGGEKRVKGLKMASSPVAGRLCRRHPGLGLGLGGDGPRLLQPSPLCKTPPYSTRVRGCALSQRWPQLLPAVLVRLAPSRSGKVCLKARLGKARACDIREVLHRIPSHQMPRESFILCHCYQPHPQDPGDSWLVPGSHQALPQRHFAHRRRKIQEAEDRPWPVR